MPSPLSGPGHRSAVSAEPVSVANCRTLRRIASSNRVALAAGDTFVIPAGDWYINLGFYCVLQYPRSRHQRLGDGTPASASPAGCISSSPTVSTAASANLTGFAWSASVINGGTNTCRPRPPSPRLGASPSTVPTLVPIVGGALALIGAFTLDVRPRALATALLRSIMIPPPPPASDNAERCRRHSGQRDTR